MNRGDSYAAEETRESEDWDKYDIREKIPSRPFYANFHAHRIHLLLNVVRHFRERGPIIWLTGDSSMDNKHWLYPLDDEKVLDPLKDESYTAAACNGYEQLLDPPRCIRDVCYWVNHSCVQSRAPYVCINAAVEASTLQDRTHGLLAHDRLVRDFCGPEDVIVVSIGGNDIALRPSLSTMLSVSWLNFFASHHNIQEASAFGVGHLRTLFRDQVRQYALDLMAKCKPKKILICMIYYPCEVGSGWADPVLNLLGYNSAKPGSIEKVQKILDMAFREFTSKIDIEGVQVIPVALSKVLDSKNADHYENRVEPSVEGGRLFGEAFVQKILEENPPNNNNNNNEDEEQDNGKAKKKKQKSAKGH